MNNISYSEKFAACNVVVSSSILSMRFGTGFDQMKDICSDSIGSVCCKATTSLQQSTTNLREIEPVEFGRI